MNNPTILHENGDPSDPIAGAPGAHPVGTSVSEAAGGAAAGAVAGTVIAGPVGTVIGAALGAIAGGLAGLSGAAAIDPTREQAYWRENFADRPYIENGSSFDDYGPAYEYGVNAHTQYPGRSFEAIEADLARDWNTARGKSSLAWERARNATRDAWDRTSDAAGHALAGDVEELRRK